MVLTFVKYKDVRGGWRWKLASPNGQIMGDSGEGYLDETNVGDAIDTIVSHIQTGAFDVKTEA